MVLPDRIRFANNVWLLNKRKNGEKLFLTRKKDGNKIMGFFFIYFFGVLLLIVNYI